MKILVFSDIHGNEMALRELIKLLPQIRYDRIVFLGDIFGYYYGQEECYNLLSNISDLLWLKGNHDDYAVKAYYGQNDDAKLIESYGHSYEDLQNRFKEAEIKRIYSLPTYAIEHIGDKEIGYFHGRPSDELEGRIYNDTTLTEDEFCQYDVVFFGHTHCKIDRWIGKTHIMSPGSLGQPRDGKGYGFLIYDTDEDSCEYHNIQVDNDSLRKVIMLRDKDLKKLQDVLDRECVN